MGRRSTSTGRDSHGLLSRSALFGWWWAGRKKGVLVKSGTTVGFLPSGIFLVLFCLIGILSLDAVQAEKRSRQQETQQRPHIIYILADDLGWNDVGFHGSEAIKTPNIDYLAYTGMMLNNYYVNPICTPSRSALMTGRYPIHTGMEHSVILETEPWGLALDEAILPQYLAPLGYARHIVGKWHLGFFEKEYTPTYRGFQTHFGYWTGRHDYYSHFSEKYISNNFFMTGLDMRLNLDPAHNTTGRYTTDLLTEAAELIIHHHDVERPLFLYVSHLAVHSANKGQPLQAPKEVIDEFSHIKDENRRIYAAMVAKLDESVGRIVTALGQRGMLNNSIIVFSTDNGGAAAGFNYNAGSNWPLRGVKNTRWEGGVRGVGLVWSPLLPVKGVRSDKMMHIVDWLPTLLTAAGVKKSDLPADLDGISLWETFMKDPTSDTSPRNEMLLSYDPLYGVSVYRYGDWKIINGTTYDGWWDGWYGPAESKRDPNDPFAVDPSKLNSLLRTASGGSGSSHGSNGADTNSVHWSPGAPAPPVLPPINPLTSPARSGNFSIKSNKKRDDGAKSMDIFSPEKSPSEMELILGRFDMDKMADSRRYPRSLKETIGKFEINKTPYTVQCGPKERPNMSAQCNPLKGRPCLFHIPTDPCEYHNVADFYPDIVDSLWTRMMSIAATAVPARNKPHDPDANPAKHCYLWDPWLSEK